MKEQTYEVISLYPDCPWEIGDILSVEKDGELYSKKTGYVPSRQIVKEETAVNLPNIFRPLHDASPSLPDAAGDKVVELKRYLHDRMPVAWRGSDADDYVENVLNYLSEPFHPVVVDFEKMGQWIGLIDRNGVKICVGDIVNKEGSKYSRTVKWRSDSALYYMTYTDDEGIERYLTFEPIAKDQVAGEPTRCYNLEVVISERVHLIPNVNNNKETRIGEILTGEQCIGRGYSNDSMGKLIGINRYYADMYNAGLYELGKIDECTIRNWQILEEKDKQSDYLKLHLQSDGEKKPERYRNLEDITYGQSVYLQNLDDAIGLGLTKGEYDGLYHWLVRNKDNSITISRNPAFTQQLESSTFILHCASPTSVDAADFDWKKVADWINHNVPKEWRGGASQLMDYIKSLKSLPATEQDGEK